MFMVNGLDTRTQVNVSNVLGVNFKHLDKYL